MPVNRRASTAVGARGRGELAANGSSARQSRRRRSAIAALGAVLLAGAAATIGHALAGDDPFAALDDYRQPRFALPPAGWAAVGIVYYLMMTAVMLRLLRLLPASRGAVALLLAVMAANEAWNALLFGLRSASAAFFGILAMIALVALALRVVGRHDRMAMVVLAAYLVWLVAYDLPWTFALAVRN